MHINRFDYSIDFTGWADDVGNLLKYEKIQLLSKIDFYHGFQRGIIHTAEKYEEKIRELNSKITELNRKCDQLEREYDEKEYSYYDYDYDDDENIDGGESLKLRIKELVKDLLDDIKDL